MRPQNLKSEAPKSEVPCFSAGPKQRRAPKSPENVRLQNLKIKAPKSRAPYNGFSPVSARGRNSVPVRGPKELKSPSKREVLKFKKRGPKKRSSLFQRGTQTTRAPKSQKMSGPMRCGIAG